MCVCLCVYVLYSAKFSRSLTFRFFKDEGWSMKFCTTKNGALFGRQQLNGTPVKFISANISKVANHEN